uniref:Calmodulin binding transcription activator 1 n=1 Tax=Anas zonorhyncha TaxID=75864 RepID=A0A8B9UWF3_9AVES
MMSRMPKPEMTVLLKKCWVEQKDDHGNSNGSHVKIFLPKKLLECLPKCSSLPKERHRWNTNEVVKSATLKHTHFLDAYILLFFFYYVPC